MMETENYINRIPLYSYYLLFRDKNKMEALWRNRNNKKRNMHEAKKNNKKTKTQKKHNDRKEKYEIDRGTIRGCMSLIQEFGRSAAGKARTKAST